MLDGGNGRHEIGGSHAYATAPAQELWRRTLSIHRTYPDIDSGRNKNCHPLFTIQTPAAAVIVATTIYGIV